MSKAGFRRKCQRADHSQRHRHPAEALVHPEGLEKAQNDGDREGHTPAVNTAGLSSFFHGRQSAPNPS